MLDAFASGLLVDAEQNADAPPERDAARADGAQRIERGDHRPFIVDCAAAVQFAVCDLRAVRRMRPAAALRHHVQMPQHDDHLVAAAVFGVAAVAVHVPCDEAEPLAQCQAFVQTILCALAEDRAVFAAVFHTPNAQQRLQCGDFLCHVRLNLFVQFHRFHLPVSECVLL